MPKIPETSRAVRWSELPPSQQRVVRCIREHGSLTREKLGEHLGLPASSISREVSPLLERGVLISDPPGIRRRHALLSNSSEVGFAIGVEIGFDRVRAAVVDFNGQPIGAVKEYRPDRRDADAFLKCVQNLLRELVIAHPKGRQVLGIGIGFADRASWNPVKAFSRSLPLNGTVPLAESLRSAFDLPVLSRSDAACAALGEWRRGRLRGVDHGLFLLYEEGIGLGIIAGGRVIFGGWNDAGEIGHIPLNDEGDYCQCGNVGCLETIASAWALQAKAKQIVATGGQVGFRRVQSASPHIDELCAMAKGGDLLARNMLMKAGRAIGRALAISATLFDPAVIVLGGALSAPDAYEPLTTPIRETFQALTAHRTPQPIAFESSSLGRDATVIGAAELVFLESLV
jgi:glucokinase